MSFHRRQISQLRPADLVDAGTGQQIDLPDGEGYYILHGFTQRRISGINAATHKAVIYGGTVAELEAKVREATTSTAAANGYRYPDPTEYVDGAAFFAPGGKLLWFTGANAVGDTWRLSVMVERVR